MLGLESVALNRLLPPLAFNMEDCGGGEDRSWLSGGLWTRPGVFDGDVLTLLYVDGTWFALPGERGGRFVSWKPN